MGKGFSATKNIRTENHQSQPTSMTFWTAHETNREEHCLWLAHFSHSQTRCQAVPDWLILSSWLNIVFSVKCHSYLFFGDTKAEIKKENFQYLKTVKVKVSRRKKTQLVVSCQVMTNQCCSLAVIFCSFVLHLTGCERINIPEIFSHVHGFTGKTVNPVWPRSSRT